MSETFFIDIDDALEGTFLNYKRDIEFCFDKSFILGGGISRIATGLDVDNNDWKGRIADSNRGLLIYGAYYF